MNTKHILIFIFIVFLTLFLPPPVVTAQTQTHIYIPVAMKAYDPALAPNIDITYIHPCRQSGSISGVTKNINPKDYNVAVFIYVSGWWNKPYWASPLTSIKSDGTWATYVTTGGNDTMATKFAAFIVPKGYNPPLLKGSSILSQELYDNAVAYIIKERSCPYRSISFSGYTWYVRGSTGPTGAGPNYFSDEDSDVFVDTNGYLHLTITYRNEHWWCSEVINESNLGYGTYIFKVISPVGKLDPNVVLGLFTWDDTSEDYAHREIDIEFTTWNIIGNQNAQYVVQPYYLSGNIYRFDTTYTGETTHGFNWQPNNIFFQSIEADSSFPGTNGIINSWNYTGENIPPPGNENARINLWLYNSVGPSKPMEIIIKSFQYIP